MQKQINSRDRWLSLLLGGVALVFLLRRSWLYVTLALGCGALLYQALSGRYLFDQPHAQEERFSPESIDATGAESLAPPSIVSKSNIDPQLDSADYDQIDEQSFQSFPASDPPATRIG